MHWCGELSSFWTHFSILPCWFETITSPILLCLAVILVISHSRRIGCLERCGYCQHVSGNDHTKAAAAKVTSCVVALAVTHSISLVLLAAIQKGLPYQYLSEALLLTAWTSVMSTLVQGLQYNVTLFSQLLLWPALFVYVYDVYAAVSMLVGGWGGMLSWVVVMQLLVSLIRVVLVAIALVFDINTKLPSEEERALREVLLGYDEEAPKDDDKGNKRKRSWFKLMGAALVYVWPKAPMLQLRGVLCVVIIVVVRVVNLAVPILYKKVVDTMAEKSGVPFMEVFYPWVLFYIIAYFFQGGTGGGSIGLLSNLRQYLWIPITQAAYRRINLDVFVHVLDLDLNYHLHRKTGEVMRIMDRGTSAMQSILSVVAFSILPQMFDIVAACVYIASALEVWVAIIVFITLFSYIPITILLTEWRGQFRRDLNKFDNAKGAKATDALLNYETVKYFNNEELERRNFADAIDNYQGVEFKLLASLNVLNIVQSLIIFLGMASGLAVCTKGVAEGSLRVGDTVLFMTMMTQLYAPLNFFGSYYRTIQQFMIDMENMFDLLAQHPEIQDKPDAKPLALTSKSVAFDNVWFSYNDTTAALKGVSFNVPGGTTMALVGSTGSGKSTVLRLLWRFYGVSSGSVSIDGQNINDITLHSLRSTLGMVPQDAVLFNDSIRYNIRYGRPDATDEEVEAAAQAAAIHNIIMDKFPKRYDTVVGERGLRLSGGEKQRVAIARAILKNAPVLLLDEATSALDSITEKNIQEAVANLRTTRTTIIVAHRLSTVMDADIITVLKDGTVAEMGSHPELISLNGIYGQMWSRQKEAADFDRPVSSVSLASVGSASGL